MALSKIATDSLKLYLFTLTITNNNLTLILKFKN